MYCPECGLEYREGVTTCTDCSVALTSEPPEGPPQPSAEWLDLETVLETGDAAQLAVARSLLEAEGIPCFTRGERLQEFFGLGRLGSGFNLLTGPVQLQVPRERGDEARQLLGTGELADFEAPADEPVEE